MFLRLLPLLPPEIVSTVTNDRQEDLLTTQGKIGKNPEKTLQKGKRVKVEEGKEQGERVMANGEG